MSFLRKSERAKNPFEASMIIDNPDIKMVEARYNDVPFFFGVGTSKQRERKVAGEVAVSKLSGKGEYETQKELEWRIYINPNVLPDGFMPEEKLKEWMAGTVSAVSGSMAVYNPSTLYKKSIPKEKTTKVEKRVTSPDEFIKDIFGNVDRESIDILLEEDKNVREYLETFYRTVYKKKHK